MQRFLESMFSDIMRHQQPGNNGRWGVRYIVRQACLLGLGGIVMGQGDKYPVEDVCNIALARGIVLGDKMYVDGGRIIEKEQYNSSEDKPAYFGDLKWVQNENLWELDLSIEFDVTTPPWTRLEKPQDWNEHYNGIEGVLWDIGDGKFYTFGGWVEIHVAGYNIPPYFKDSYQLPDARVFAYDPQTGNWTSKLQKNVGRYSDSAYTQSARNQVGYTFGGFKVNEADATKIGGGWVNTMSKYNFTMGEFTSLEDMPPEIGNTKNVVMHNLERVGKEGVLVTFAGSSNRSDGEQPRPMNEIWVYDIESSTWMKQETTGALPGPGGNSCTVLVPAPDLSSYQIYVFSGSFLDMYVLSIPLFSWTKIQLKNYPDEFGIAQMTCGLYEERQLIIVPGVADVTPSVPISNQTGGRTYWIQCNKGTQVRVFDTYDWEVKSTFDPNNKGSRVSPSIVKLVGGSDIGGATLKEPLGGWDDPALGPIFATRNELPTPTSSPHATSSPDSTLNNTGNTAKPNRGAIIGGVIGACVVVLMGGVLIFFWKKKFSQAEPSEERGGEILRVELQGKIVAAELQEDYRLPELGESGKGVAADVPAEEANTIPIDHVSSPPR